MKLEDLDFKIPALVYGLASAIDYSATTIGLNSGKIEELNPIYNNLMNEHDVGLFFPKLAMTLGVIGLLKYANNKQIHDIKFKSKYVLYTGAALTTGVGLSSLI